MPFRIRITSDAVTEPRIARGQAKLARGLGFPSVFDRVFKGRLAIAGGGPSLAYRYEELKDFDEVWAINGTASWLKKQGIDCALFSVDPQREMVNFVGEAERGVLASCTHPEVFKQLKDVSLFDLWDDEDPASQKQHVRGCTTSATCAPHLAAQLGFESVHLFGCDSSFAKTTHVDRDENDLHPDQVIVRTGERSYRTNLQMMVQAETLAYMVRDLPQFIFNHSDGLLKGVIEYWDTWEVTHFSDSMRIGA